MSVSVIIPTLNRPKELVKCVESVLCQKKRAEIIYVIDNSDNKQNQIVLNQYILSNQIQYLHLRGSVDFLRNSISKIVKTKYIAFLDDDDYWHENYLYENLQLLESLKLDIIYSSMNIVNEKNKKIGTLVLKKNIKLRDFLVFNIGFFLSNMIVKKKTFLDLGGLDTNSGSSDRDILIKIIKNDYRYYFNENILLDRQVTENNWSQNDYEMLKMNLKFFINYFYLMDIKLIYLYLKKILKIILSLFRIINYRR